MWLRLGWVSWWRRDRSLFHLFVADFDSGGVVGRDEVGIDRQAGLGAGGVDVVDHGLVVAERLARPALADLRKCPTFNGVSLGGATRVVVNSDAESVAVTQAVWGPCLHTPGPGAGARVREREQLGGSRVAVQSVVGQPLNKVVDCEVRGIVAGVDRDTGVVRCDVVDTIGQSDAFGVEGEVVVEYQDGILFPCCPVVLEVPDQFAVLGIDAHDRLARLLKGVAHRCDIGELSVTTKVLFAVELLRVGPQLLTEALQELCDGVGAHLDASRGKLVCNLVRGAPGPFDTAD